MIGGPTEKNGERPRFCCVSLWPLRSIPILSMCSHFTRVYSISYCWYRVNATCRGIAILFLLVVRCIVCSTYLSRDVHYRAGQLTSVGMVILVQGSQLTTIRIRACCDRRDCQPVQQPVKYASAATCRVRLSSACRSSPRWSDHGNAHLITFPPFSPPLVSHSTCSLLLGSIVFFRNCQKAPF